MEELRAKLKDKKRVVVKIGSSSLQHSETGDLDYTKMDILVRELCNIRNQGKDVILEIEILRQKVTADQTAAYDCTEAGVRGNWTGKADDDLPADFLGVQSSGCADSAHQKYN